jgi:hypothetical protein
MLDIKRREFIALLGAGALLLGVKAGARTAAGDAGYWFPAGHLAR